MSVSNVCTKVYRSPNFVEAQGPPPSYGSLYGQIQEARVNSNDAIGFCTAVCAIIFGTIGCLVVLIIKLAIPIACITIGVIYKDDCTVQPLIPVFLIMFGATSALQTLIGIGKRLRNDGNEEENIPLKYFDSLLQFFVLVWFIASSVCVFQVFQPEYDNPHLPKYCNYVLYSFAFDVLLIINFLMVLAIISVCSAACGLDTD